MANKINSILVQSCLFTSKPRAAMELQVGILSTARSLSLQCQKRWELNEFTVPPKFPLTVKSTLVEFLFNRQLHPRRGRLDFSACACMCHLGLLQHES